MKKYIIASVASILPVVAFAQNYNLYSLSSIATSVGEILALIFPVLVGVAVFVVIWGIFKFVLNAGDEEARKSGRTFILWGVVGIFLMLSVWGLINILLSTFSVNKTVLVDFPQVVPNTGGTGSGSGSGSGGFGG